MAIVDCPRCQVRVLSQSDGCCPSCGTTGLSKVKAISPRTQLQWTEQSQSARDQPNPINAESPLAVAAKGELRLASGQDLIYGVVFLVTAIWLGTWGTGALGAKMVLVALVFLVPSLWFFSTAFRRQDLHDLQNLEDRISNFGKAADQVRKDGRRED